MKNILLIATLVFFMTGCRDMKLGEHTIDDVFTDKQVVDLIYAAHDNNEQKVSQLIDSGVDIDASGLEGLTPLYWTVFQKDYDASELLLKAGADPNIKSDTGGTILCVVAGGKYPDFLALLLKYKADPDCINSDGDSALKVALFQNRERNLYMLIEAGADINAHNGYGRTIAVNAAALGRMDLVEYFLDQGYENDLPFLRKSMMSRRLVKDSEMYKIKQRLLQRLK